MNSPKYASNIPLFDVVPTSTESQESVYEDCKAFGNQANFPTAPLHDKLSTHLSTSLKEDDCYTFLEDVVKITRHRTVSSEQNDDAEDPLLQCCLCGTRTLERCSHCNWAPYCSIQCLSLHRPIHQCFCVPSYAQLYPRLLGLDVVPIQMAVERIRQQTGAGILNRESGSGVKVIPTRESPNCMDSAGAPVSRNTEPGNVALTESSLIQRRARIILAHMRESRGRPMCAICGDPCNQSNAPEKTELFLKRNPDLEVENAKATGTKQFSGDAKDVQPTPQRLVRFGGMLLCASCVEIQAAAL